MSISDRIYLILADGTPQYDELRNLVGEPTSSIKSMSPSTEFNEGIDLDDVATPFDQRLAVFGDVPMSTFEVLA